MHDYYSENTDTLVEFTIVGDGKEKQHLQRLVDQYGLSEYITFAGMKNGAELTAAYNEADIALGSFGLYKRGTSYSSALKTREYISHGLPIVSGCTEDVFQKNAIDFYLEFPNDSTPVNIDRIIEFYNNTYGLYGGEKIRSLMRGYAEKYIDIKTTFAPVIHYLQETMN